MSESQTELAQELDRRLWRRFDAVKVICEADTPQAWAGLYRALADVPESQRPRS